MKQILFSFFLSILSLTSFAQIPTVVDVIVNSADHDTLEAAVVAAGLADDLSGTGPFTVFAPTDAAFANLPAGTIEALLSDPTGSLTNILLYHVVGAQALSTDLTDGQMITTLQGQDVTVTIGTNGVMINNAMVTVADITTGNGVVHVIDAVLIPQAPQTNTILDIVINSVDHDTLEAAVIAAGLTDELSGPGPLTVFAPTDAAFANLPAGTIEALLGNVGELQNILLYHVTSGSVLSTDLTDGQQVQTLTFFEPLVVTIGANGVMINNAMVTVADIMADNGVIHVIDAVLLPQITNSVSQLETSYFTFPNPVNSYINIPTTNNVNVQIMTVGGQMVLNQNFNGSVNINTDNLSNGIYVMKLSGDNYNQVCKFVK
jgi:uncharacterized surface protein with fasciclin (FAS1) repeats